MRKGTAKGKWAPLGLAFYRAAAWAQHGFGLHGLFLVPASLHHALSTNSPTRGREILGWQDPFWAAGNSQHLSGSPCASGAAVTELNPSD